MKAEGCSRTVSSAANVDQSPETYYKHETWQQLPTNCSGTLGKRFSFCLGRHNIQTMVHQEQERTQKAKEGNADLSTEPERKQLLQ